MAHLPYRGEVNLQLEKMASYINAYTVSDEEFNYYTLINEL